MLAGVTFSRPRDISNEYLPLANLKQDILEGMEGGKKFRVERTAKPDLHKAFRIGDKTIETLVFEDRAYEDGQLVEVAMDYFAQADNGAVYYFGEDVDEYENGKMIGHDGAWLFGKDTPTPGILFPAQLKLNDKWRSEDVSNDISEIDELVSITEIVVTPSGTYKNCAKVKEYLADGTIEYKYYAKGVGVVREQPEDGDTFLVSHNAPQAAIEKTTSQNTKNAGPPKVDFGVAKNETLLNAMSPYEDMAEAALDKDTKGIAEAIHAAGSETADVLKALPNENVKSFEERLRAIKDAAKSKDHFSVAVNAVEMFRLLTDSLDATKLEVPKEVSLLDYAGFRLQVLAAAKEPDWEKMKLTVIEADKWWKTIEEKVEDSSLVATFRSTLTGLQQAIESKNLPMLRFAAQIDLDLVDLLESAFE